MKDKDKPSLRYDALGASADKDGLHEILDNIGALPTDNYFCQLLEDIALDSGYKSFIHCDGAGTKAIVPYLWHKETGDVEYFGRLAQDALVMNLDDVYCLGDVESLVLANAIARNSRHINETMLSPIIKNYYTLGESLKSIGIPLTISGGETADCADTVRTLIVDATMFGRIKKSALINPNAIIPGDVIVSLASDGQASYENVYNSGIGSNGLTLARHALLHRKNAELYPEIVDTLADHEMAYQGPFSVTDTPSELPQNMTIGDALSSPTRTYAPVLREIYSRIPVRDLHAVIHLTGGAHGKVLRFLPDSCRVVKDSLVTPPPIFSLIQEHGRVPLREMYRVFNMGQRLDIFCPEVHAKTIMDTAKTYAISAKVTGYVESHSKKEVLLKTDKEEIVYN
jgi:phosphoribosylformylglycinamidine cyclo-ligase